MVTSTSVSLFRVTCGSRSPMLFGSEKRNSLAPELPTTMRRLGTKQALQGSQSTKNSISDVPDASAVSPGAKAPFDRSSSRSPRLVPTTSTRSTLVTVAPSQSSGEPSSVTEKFDPERVMLMSSSAALISSVDPATCACSCECGAGDADNDARHADNGDHPTDQISPRSHIQPVPSKDAGTFWQLSAVCVLGRHASLPSTLLKKSLHRRHKRGQILAHCGSNDGVGTIEVAMREVISHPGDINPGDTWL